jgi:hypothetical protein
MPVVVRHPQIGHDHVESRAGDALCRPVPVIRFFAGETLAAQSPHRQLADGRFIIDDQSPKISVHCRLPKRRNDLSPAAHSFGLASARFGSRKNAFLQVERCYVASGARLTAGSSPINP